MSVDAATILITLALGLLVGAIAAAAWAALRPRTAQPPAAPAEPLATPLAVVLPVWSRQIRTARTTADTAVRDLATAFASVARDLEAALARSRALQRELAAEDGGVAATRACRADLQHIVEALRGSEQARSSATSELGRHAAELRDTTREVQELALQTRLIALNAAIEASRAGQAGRAFATVTRELERLARGTEQASERMHVQLRQVATSLHGLEDASRDQDRGGLDTVRQAEATIAGVIERFEHVTDLLSDGVASLEGESRRVRDGLSDALVCLQFQDRVSQILHHLAGELDGLRGALAPDGCDAAALAHWRARLGGDYSTREELDNLAGRAARPAIAAAGEVTFF